MNIGILGSGNVAKTLAAGFLGHGHAVTMGTREPAKLDNWLAAHATAKVGSFADAARFGQLVVLAVKGSAAAQALVVAKAVINACQNIDTSSGRILERMAQSPLILSEDHKEGVKAFREKRPPQYKGR